jgi:predicted Zn finger-like uncharacterized protein
MSLATRCTSCGTVFRVVQDQLKVSEGWVRCGRCNQVFNALEGLFDLERDAPIEAWQPPAASASPKPAPVASPDTASSATPAQEEETDASLVDKIDAQLLSPRRTGFGALASLAPAERRHEDFADARFDTELPSDSDRAPLLDRLDPEPAPDDRTDDEAAPEFVRQAEREARWRGSRARSALFAATALLSVTLVLQVGHHFRDRLAARWAPAHTALVAWCGLAGCTVGAPRRIEDVSVESTSLTKANVPDAFRLSVVLRNRAATLLAVPWIDLTLTDAAGVLVARRALSPQDLRAASTSLAGGAELPLQVVLSPGTSRVTGYTVEVFYP